MKENQNNHYFNEVWEVAMKDFFWQKTHRNLESYWPHSNCIHISKFSIHNPMGFVEEPIPEFLKEWIEKNPCPNIHRNQFIDLLAKRVEALEAALAEKGGAQ